MRQTLPEYVARQIRAEMGAQDMTAARLARKLEVSEVWVGRRIKGRMPITLAELERFADALDVPVADLLPTAAERVA